MRKRKLLSLVLSLLLLIGIYPTTAFAGVTQELWVNGENIITAPDNTIVCGSGVAYFDPVTKTLQLNNATINNDHNGMGIWAENYFSDQELILEFIGTNSISHDTNIQYGIYTQGKLKVIGSGSININTKDKNGSGVFGIYAYKGCNITDATISLSSEPITQGVSIAIDADASGAYFICNNATINSTGYTHNINVPDGYIDIQNSKITIENGFKGINGGIEVDHFQIIDSEITCHVSGEPKEFSDGSKDYPVAISNGYNIVINHSKLTLSSTKSNAIYSAASLNFLNGSEINATGFHPALYGNSSISIINSKVEAVSTGDSAIYTPGSLTIGNASDVTANGKWCGLQSKGNMTIGSSKVKAVSTDDNAIYTTGLLSIGICDVTAKGKWCGLQSYGNMTISNSTVEAESTNDIGIFSRASMLLAGGQIHAEGGSNFAAIAARIVKTADEAAESKIMLGGLVEKNSGKLAFSDWFLHTSTSQTRSWTSFVSKDAADVEVDSNGGLVNALKEVWLGTTACAFGHTFSTEFTVDTPATCTTEGSKSIHCLKCDAVKDITVIPATGHTESNWIIDKAATLTEEGSRHKECTVCKELLKTEAIAKLPSKDAAIDSGTGIRVEYEDGSVFSDKVELSITSLSKDEISKLNDTINKAAKGLTLSGLYDIKLMKDGVAVQPDGKVKVTIPLTDEMKAMTDLKVVYIDDEGNVTIIPSLIVDGKIIFTTDHFSYYGVIGKAKADTSSPQVPQTGDTTPIIPLALVVVISLATATALFKRKRNAY